MLKTFCISVGIFTGLVWQYLPEIGIAEAHDRVVSSTHDPVFMILIGVWGAISAYVVYTNRDKIFTEDTDYKGGREL